MQSLNPFHFGNEFFSKPRSFAARRFPVLVFAFLLGGAPVAGAATNVVTVCDQASLQSAVASGGTIQFGCDGTIVLSNTLVISQNTVIDGAGYNVTISGNDAVRVFQVNPGIAFTLANLTVANGRVGTNVAQPQFVGDALGGGLYNNGGAVTLSAVTFTSNSAQGGDYSGSGHGMGGAIYQTGGSLAGTNCAFVGNKAEGGHAISGVGRNALGGGIFNQSGTVLMAGSTFISNGVAGATAGSGTIGHGDGGGIYTTNGVVTLLNCQFFDNWATAKTNQFIGAVQGGYASGGAVHQESGTLNLIGSKFATNRVVATQGERYWSRPGKGIGGALFNQGTLNATNCSFLGNFAQGGRHGDPGADGVGGAICNLGVANLVGTTIEANQCVGGQGSVFYVGTSGSPNPSGQGYGGGIYNGNLLLMLESTLNGNIAEGGLGAYIGSQLVVGRGGNGNGGGLFNIGVFNGTNNTLYGNIARGGSGGVRAFNDVIYDIGTGGDGCGGGIFNSTNGAMTITHFTVTSNAAIGGVGNTNTMGLGIGGGIVSGNGMVKLYNSIVANSTGTNCVGNTIVDGGGNISSDASVSFTASGSRTNLNPMLGVPGYYGGPTPTIPLLPGSPAINSGLAAFCSPTDQRGVVRAFAGVCDIGAFEVVPLYTISGKVTGVQGAIVTASGSVGMPDSNGSYVITNLPAMTYLVTPSKPGYVFSPPTKLLALGANTSDVNFTAYRANTITLESWTGNSMGFAFPGTVGQNYEIQSSTNLVNWVVVSTNTVPAGGVIQFTVTNSLTDGAKYWRAVKR